MPWRDHTQIGGAAVIRFAHCQVPPTELGSGRRALSATAGPGASRLLDVTYPAAIVRRGLLIGLLILAGLPLAARASSGAASDAAGGKIAFLRTGGDSDTGDIYLMNADGTGERNLTHHPGVNGAPSWSPDGRRITFDSFRCPGNAASCDSTIFVMDADGSGQHRLTRRQGDRSPAWSPSGDRIAFARQVPGDLNYEIFVMKVDGTGVRRLTRNHVEDDLPAWSPDGRKIAFTHWPTGNFGDGGRAIYVMNAGGG